MHRSQSGARHVGPEVAARFGRGRCVVVNLAMVTRWWAREAPEVLVHFSSELFLLKSSVTG